MRRKWKLGCGASLEVLKMPGNGQHFFDVRIVGKQSAGWFAEVPFAGGTVTATEINLMVRAEAIPKLSKILQYLESQLDKG